MTIDAQRKETIAENVNRILSDRGLSRHWLAVKIDEYDSAIARVCNATHLCSADMIAKIADALNVSADELLFPRRKKYPKAS